MTENKQRNDADAVLSSVRRIVTRQLPPEEMIPEDWEQSDESKEEGTPGRLVLTEALRVEESAPVPIRRIPAQTPLEERIAELERAVGAVADEWEPDGSEPPETERPRRLVLSLPVGKGMLDEDPDVFAGDEEPVAEKIPFIASAPAPDQLPITGEDDKAELAPSILDDEFAGGELIDEDKLRELVSEIVRSELQGELGERITRNIRKLVRREIHRAIMTRDFG